MIARCSHLDVLFMAGIAINKDGVVYFADGANIRAIDESGIIRTIIGSQGPPQYWIPFPCQKAINISMVFVIIFNIEDRLIRSMFEFVSCHSKFE